MFPLSSYNDDDISVMFIIVRRDNVEHSKNFFHIMTAKGIKCSADILILCWNKFKEETTVSKKSTLNKRTAWMKNSKTAINSAYPLAIKDIARKGERTLGLVYMGPIRRIKSKQTYL